MKTINLTLTGLNVSEVLMALKINKLLPLYLGTDQNCNLLYSVKYEHDKEYVIEKILKYMTEVDEMEKGFDAAFIQIINETNNEIAKRFAQSKAAKFYFLKGIYKIIKTTHDE